MSARSKTRVVLAAGALALVVASVASAIPTQAMKLSARMNSAQVVPDKPKGKVAFAAGTFTGTLTPAGSKWKLAWKLTYSRLDNPSIVIADIHYGKPGHFGPYVARLCGPCKASPQQGVTRIPASWIPAIKLGNTFMTILTGKNPNGEIRGQIRVR